MNILLFLTDQQRLEGVGAYGRSSVRTPHLDRLAEQSTRFENAYTACPLCTPARASLLTGLYPHAHGMTANLHEMGCAVHEIPDHPRLLSRRLAAAGYQCGFTGKWHLGTDHHTVQHLEPWWQIPVENALPSNRGFVGQDFPGHGEGGIHYPTYLRWLADHGYPSGTQNQPTDGEKITGFGILNGPAESTVSHFLADHTISLIDRFSKTKTPFFISHNDWGPHGAHLVPQSHYDLYRDIEIPEWPNFRWTPPPGHPSRVKTVPHAEQYTWNEWAEVLRHYYAFCSLIDDQLGRILTHLESQNLTDNTLILFSSDHGETLGSHGGLTDKGFSHFEEIQRIPLIIFDPRTRQKHVCADLASLIDLYPTICDYAGTPCEPDTVQGRSLRPLIEGKKVPWRDSVFVEFFGLGQLSTPMITCRHQHWKYGWTATGQDELYDLESDPHELHNRIEDTSFTDILLDLRRRMFTFLHESGYPGATAFLRTRLGWNIDRQYHQSPDPSPKSVFLTSTAW